MKRVRVAIVGTGHIAQVHHARAIRSLRDELELVAVADTDRERARAFSRRHGDPPAYDDLDELLEREHPELVHVCTPPVTHADVAVRCLEGGAWVLCEKPPCMSLRELDAIEAAERATDRACAFVFQFRFGSGVRHLNELIKREELGRPLMAICHTTWFRPREYFEVPWRGRWETEAGGPTVGHGIHCMDLLLHLLGGWKELRAMMGRVARPVETEDVSLASVRFAAGALGSIVNSVVSPREETYLRLDFERATVELRFVYEYGNEDWRYTLPDGSPDARRLREWQRIATEIRPRHEAQLTALLRALRAGERPPVSGGDVRPTMELVTALYKAAITGQPVRHGTIEPTDPFYHRLHGGLSPWARPPTPIGTTA